MTIPLEVHNAESDLDNIAFGGACIPNSSSENNYVLSNVLNEDENSYEIM